MNRGTALFIFVVVAALLLYLLSGVLLPFVAGFLIAYFLDPVAGKLEKWGCSRTLATVLITGGFFAVTGAALVLLFPLLQGQIMGLVAKAPTLIAALRDQAGPLLERLQTNLDESQIAMLPAATRAKPRAGSADYWAGF
jgi:predicted PurR-regulated permease PerM